LQEVPVKNGFVKSSPHFFRIIQISALLIIITLLLAAPFFPAPLQEPANPALTPNPVRSAWFLLWIQEVIGWSRWMIYPVMILCGLFFALPLLPGSGHIHRAKWFPREQLVITVLALVVFAAVIVLTIIAMFFRGANWSLTVLP
jgi:hypothetical protein